jgi:hypothetical protein
MLRKPRPRITATIGLYIRINLMEEDYSIRNKEKPHEVASQLAASKQP